MFGIGFSEMLFIGGIIVLIFGASQIPKVARAVGEGLREFKKGVKEAKESDESEVNKIDDAKK